MGREAQWLPTVDLAAGHVGAGCATDALTWGMPQYRG